ncbi:MAG: hypothetical protein AABY18_01490 [Candidatus Thermoplasmatota archaeon]
MRGTAVLLALLLAGCNGGKNGAGSDAGAQAAAPEAFDQLTALLPANSTTWQDFLVVEDSVAVGNSSVEFTTGRGMSCQGNADSAAPNRTGWVACLVRLAARPDAAAQDVHELGIGYDLQRLTLRQAAEPVEWRVLVLLADATTAFDSGWRLVDLAPGLSDPVVRVDVSDPCDAPDAVERSEAGRQRGTALLTVEFNASHGRPFVQVDLGPRSRPGEAESTPFAGHGSGNHSFDALFDVMGEWRPLLLELTVDLEAPETPGGPTGDACELAIGGETQDWSVNVGIIGVDGALEFKARTVRVDVVLDAMAA